MTIKPEQLIAARGLCRLSQLELAELSGVSLATIKRIEQKRSGWRARTKTLEALFRVFEEHGVELFEDRNTYGVRRRKANRNDKNT